MIWWQASIAKRGLGGTLRLMTFTVLAVILAVLIAYSQITRWYYIKQAGKYAAIAKEQSEIAKAQAQRARQAETSQQIAADTHRNIDTIRVEAITRTEQAAQRIESKADANPQPSDSTAAVPDDDIVRDVQDAEARYRTAADRLRH